MSRKAKTLSLSKSFIEGISPVRWLVLVRLMESRGGISVPLMILQKMQAAAMVDNV
jgi:hypothetical protein